MLNNSDFTPFQHPHAMNSSKVHKHKEEACAQQFADFSAAPGFSAAWELCSAAAPVNPFHSWHSPNANIQAGEIFC